MSAPVQTLTGSLSEAWVERARREARLLRAAEQAPLLFRPEAVRAAAARYERAVAQVRATGVVPIGATS